MKIDFGRTADDYASHRAGYPDRLFDFLAAKGLGLPEQKLLDLATGTGHLARALASRGAEVSALDLSDSLLDSARQLAQQQSLRIAWHQGRAEATGLPAGQFDVVTAGQCWHWFDRPAAAREVDRLLKPGGAAVLCHFDWLPLAGNVVAATETLILKHNPQWAFAGGDGIHGHELTDLAEAGFRELESYSFDEAVAYSHQAWRGRIRASAGVGASLPAEAVIRFDQELGELLQNEFPAEPLAVPHRLFVVIGKKA